jgi:hypothetical protein
MMLFGVEVTNLWGVGLWLVAYFAAIVWLMWLLVREGKAKRRKKQ